MGTCSVRSSSKGDGNTADRDETAVAIILAADSTSAASVATTDADDRDGRAVEANKGINVLDDDTQQAKDATGRGGASSSGLLAALKRAGRAGAAATTASIVAGRDFGRVRGGDHKGDRGEHDKGGKLGGHSN